MPPSSTSKKTGILTVSYFLSPNRPRQSSFTLMGQVKMRFGPVTPASAYTCVAGTSLGASTLYVSPPTVKAAITTVAANIFARFILVVLALVWSVVYADFFNYAVRSPPVGGEGGVGVLTLKLYDIPVPIGGGR